MLECCNSNCMVVLNFNNVFIFKGIFIKSNGSVFVFSLIVWWRGCFNNLLNLYICLMLWWIVCKC